MKIGIVTNLDARGLAKDAKLLSRVLRSWRHEVELLQFDKSTDSVFPLIIFLEVAPRHYVRLSRNAPWIFVNPEFLGPEDIKTIKKSFSKVFCKTREAHRICTEMFGDKAHYTGFVSEGRMDASVIRQKKCLHIAGHSQVKNTEAIINAWRWRKNGKSLKAHLTVVYDFPIDDLPENVELLREIDDEKLHHLQNECRFHIQPSQSEGFGHVLHESLSVNANIVTVDAAPMNEIASAYKIPSCGHTMFNSVKMYQVSALDIYNAVSDLLKLGHNGFASNGAPRKEFEEGNEAFKNNFREHLSELGLQVAPVVVAPQPMRKTGEGKTIAFLGNFRAPESTENQILWALEQRLDMQVVKLQENETSLADLNGIGPMDYFLWVRTPKFLWVADVDMMEFLGKLRDAGIPSLSVHLDKFFGIPDREKLIGVHPFWKTAFVFTADGSRQEDFKERGVNHIYMRPAASEVFHHPGRPRPDWTCDVAFVGARGYHLEHPWRGQLISFLENTYGNRFRLVESGVRGHDLNDFYSSAKVCVADCFGSGKIPDYFSDRMVETPMRYGFLLCPDIQGLRIPLATFKPEDLNDLQKQIDYWLSHQKERNAKIEECADYVWKHDSWTVRMDWILRSING